MNTGRRRLIPAVCGLLAMGLIAIAAAEQPQRKLTYRIVDTGQDRCFADRREIAYPKPGKPFFGQDAQVLGNQPSYRDNGDRTITDLVTGLIWQKTPDAEKRTFAEAIDYAKKLKLAGRTDWRVPSIKELFSVADFRGNMHTKTPYIDTKAFAFEYPDTAKGGRDMDAQYRSSTRYVGLTMRGDRSVFGFNFADGRIKSYPDGSRGRTRGAGRQYVRCVRGPKYGENDFLDNRNGTITDRATGLTWQKADSGRTMNWKDALAHAEKLKLAGKTDWRLPNVKELQSLVDYRFAPDARDPKRRRAAIDPLFKLTQTESWFWTGTTHIETGGGYYVCFGQGLSAWLVGGKKMNAHGAGAVRSDPKSGDPSRYADGHGPQGDEVRILNFVRCVRGGTAEHRKSGPPVSGAQTGPFVRRLDRNRDGKVSRSEFDGPARHFDRLDRNNDGYLTEDEAPSRPPGGGPPSRR